MGQLPISLVAIQNDDCALGRVRTWTQRHDGNDVSHVLPYRALKAISCFWAGLASAAPSLFCGYETRFAPVSGRLEFYFQARLFHQAYSFLLLLGRAQLDDD